MEIISDSSVRDWDKIWCLLIEIVTDLDGTGTGTRIGTMEDMIHFFLL